MLNQMKKLDSRISHVMEEAVHYKHRSIVMLIGDEGKSQIVQLHQLLCKVRQQMNLTILWCMKKDLSFGGASKTKRLAKSRREVTQGKITADTQESFEDFIKRANTTYCKYEETERILGNTYDLLILQDFEALSPNVLARTVETVRGGGMVLLLLRTMTSLEQLYSLTMDVHARFRSETHPTIRARFNRRFLLSFVDCPLFLCLDDALNVLPITDTLRSMKAKKRTNSIDGIGGGILISQEKDLLELRARLAGTNTTATVVTKMAYTLDQAKVLLQLLKLFDSSVLSHTVALTAGRGRGKSAALGIAAAVALQFGFSRVLVTSPSPENLRTFFSFVSLALKEFGYVERQDFTVMQSTSAEWKNVTLRIDVHRKHHRQTICYVAPDDVSNFAHAELLIIDEAAAIPLPKVQRMFGPYLIFLSSTVSGYEGTGRSLSLKLISSLRSSSPSSGASSGGIGPNGRSFHELSLNQPIRYGPNDPVERWLYRVLCLDTSVSEPSLLPHPSNCVLYHVNRDALFSYHPLAEELLQRIVSLLVHAHYKNQPNDLVLLADAPAHDLFVLLDAEAVALGTQLPDVLTVIQVCHEGGLDVKAVERRLEEGSRPHGDLIPFTLSQSFLDPSVAGRSGIRIVRIATHPSLQRAGYGRRAIALLSEYYAASRNRGANPPPGVSIASDGTHTHDIPTMHSTALMDSDLAAPTYTPALLQRVVASSTEEEEDEEEASTTRQYSPIVPEYIGVSFGLTLELFNFWSSLGFSPVYLRQVTHENTGEFTMVMLRGVWTPCRTQGDGGTVIAAPQQGTGTSPSDTDRWIHSLSCEFHRRLLTLLGSTFRDVPLELCTMLALHGIPTHDPRKMDHVTTWLPEQQEGTAIHQERTYVDGVPQLNAVELFTQYDFSMLDMERLRRYVSLRADYSVIADLVPFLGRLYFQKRMYRYPYRRRSSHASESTPTSSAVGGVQLTATETAVLAAVALQAYYLTDLTANHSNRAKNEYVATSTPSSRMAVSGPFANFPLPQLRTFLHKSIVAIVTHLDELIRLEPGAHLDGKGKRSSLDHMGGSVSSHPVGDHNPTASSNEIAIREDEKVHIFESRDPTTGKLVKKMRSETAVVNSKRLKRTALTHGLPST